MKKNVVIDFETLGTTADCVVLSLGAVTEDGDSFYVVFDSNMQTTRKISPATLAWWEAQTPEARDVLTESRHGDCCTPEDGVKGFISWLKIIMGDDEAVVWSLGGDFDIAIINHIMGEAGIEPCWKYWNTRCLRTLGALYPQVKRPKTNNHNALDDAKNEMEWLKLLLAQHEGRKS